MSENSRRGRGRGRGEKLAAALQEAKSVDTKPTKQGAGVYVTLKEASV